MSEIKWIKLSTNMFSDEKIKLIRTLPEGPNIIVIWIQLLCLAGKTNDGGGIYMGQNLYYTDEMLATLCDQPVNIMRIALKTLTQFGMIETSGNGYIEIVNWEKHQNVDGMERIKEQNAERQQLYYYRKKIKQLNPEITNDQLPEDVEDLKKLHKNLTLGLTLPNGTDKELEEDKNKRSKDTLSGKPDDSSSLYQSIINYLNTKAERQYKHTTAKTQSLIKARFNEGFTEDDFKVVIDNKVNEWKNSDMSKFLRPETLFGPKFEGYLNQGIPKKNSNEKLLDWE